MLTGELIRTLVPPVAVILVLLSFLALYVGLPTQGAPVNSSVVYTIVGILVIIVLVLLILRLA